MAEAPPPVLLEDGSSQRDWPGAAYRPEVRIGADFARIAHRIEGAPALDRLVDAAADRQHAAQAVVGLGRSGPEPQRLAVVVHRFVDASELA